MNKESIQELAKELLVKAKQLAHEAIALDHGLDNIEDIKNIYSSAYQIKQIADVLEDKAIAFEKHKQEAIELEVAGMETYDNLEQS